MSNKIEMENICRICNETTKPVGTTKITLSVCQNQNDNQDGKKKEHIDTQKMIDVNTYKCCQSLWYVCVCCGIRRKRVRALRTIHRREARIIRCYTCKSNTVKVKGSRLVINGHSIVEYKCEACKSTWYVCPSCNIRRDKRKEMGRHINENHKLTNDDDDDMFCHHTNVPQFANNNTDIDVSFADNSNDDSCFADNSNGDSGFGGEYNNEQGSNDNYDNSFDDSSGEEEDHSVEKDIESVTQSMKRLTLNFQNDEAWGNSISGEFFRLEHTLGLGKGSTHTVANSLGNLMNDVEIEDRDYHLLGTLLFSDMSKTKTEQVVSYLNATLDRMKRTDFGAITPATSVREIRQKYTEGPRSILQNMPVPAPYQGGLNHDNFAMVGITQTVNHIMARDDTNLLTLRLDDESCWKDENGKYHSLLLKEVHEWVSNLDDPPDDLRVHLLMIWSDGFQKNSLVKLSKTDLQFFTLYLVPEDSVRDIKRYTAPYSLGIKQKEHQSTLLKLLQETASLEKVHWRYSAKEGDVVPTVVVTSAIQNDHPERSNNTMTTQNGTYTRRWGHSTEFNDSIPSCRNCYLRRLSRCGVNQPGNIVPPLVMDYCPDCADWWDNNDNKLGWIKKPKDFPTVSNTDYSDEAPSPPDGRNINDEIMLPPCMITFSFLLLAFNYAKYQYYRKWTKEMTKQYLRTCCFHGILIQRFLECENFDLLKPPDLWQNAILYRVKLEHFPDTPMHLLFLGIMKHLLGQVERLFRGNSKAYKMFSRKINSYLTLLNKLAVSWCRTYGFSASDKFATVGWQSDQYLAFARLSLVYFGYIDDFKDCLDNNAYHAFRQMIVAWNLVISSLFTEDVCDAYKVDNYVKLFLTSCVTFGCHTKSEVTNENKRVKSKNKAAFFDKTTNYFSLLNFPQLILRYKNIHALWEGEREKYIKFAKRFLFSMSSSDTYLPHVLQKMLQQHCLEYLVEGNIHYNKKQYSRTEQYKIYANHNDIVTHYLNAGQMFIGVRLIDEDGVFVIYKEDSSLRLQKILFNDSIGKYKLNLWYAGVSLTIRHDTIIKSVKNHAMLNKMIKDIIVVHPMIAADNEFKKSNGHVAIAKNRTIRLSDGKFHELSLDFDGSIFNHVVID